MAYKFILEWNGSKVIAHSWERWEDDPLPPEVWCLKCNHPHMDYLEDEYCVSCGCWGEGDPCDLEGE